MPTSVRSHAKINLGLYIGGPRPDGFHGLTTVYQTLDVHDVVGVTAKRAEATVIRLTSNDHRVPCDSRNTAWKMVELALEGLGLCADVHIHIEKRLPVQGGLGAGSANAVAALVGLETELGIWNQQVSKLTDQRVSWSAARLKIAAKVGSDVPLFLIGGTILGLDRGQDVYPLPDLDPVWCVVALPEMGVSTPQAFRDWDALCLEEGLTGQASIDKLNELSRAYASAFTEGQPGIGSSGVPAQMNQTGDGDLAETAGSALVRTGITSWITNDFERVVFRQHPSLAEIKRALAAEGSPEAALLAMLSGSGSALFGLYQARGAAEVACERLRQNGVKSLLTRTIARREYWEQMLQPTGC